MSCHETTFVVFVVVVAAVVVFAEPAVFVVVPRTMQSQKIAEVLVPSVPVIEDRVSSACLHL